MSPVTWSNECNKYQIQTNIRIIITIPAYFPSTLQTLASSCFPVYPHRSTDSQITRCFLWKYFDYCDYFLLHLLDYFLWRLLWDENRALYLDFITDSTVSLSPRAQLSSQSHSFLPEHISWLRRKVIKFTDQEYSCTASNVRIICLQETI